MYLYFPPILEQIIVIRRPPVTQKWIQQIWRNFLICILYPLWGKCILPFVHWNFCLLCRIFQSWAILPTIFSKLLPSEMAQLHKSGYNNFTNVFILHSEPYTSNTTKYCSSRYIYMRSKILQSNSTSHAFWSKLW